MSVTVIAGEQRGDEGKGRFADILAKEHEIVARFNGGPNAGHTVPLAEGGELDLHVIPSGIVHDHTVNIIGNGVYIDPLKLLAEIEQLQAKGIPISPNNLKISSAAHLILPHHISGDIAREATTGSQGTTKSGIAQVAADKYMRIGARGEDIKNGPDGLYKAILEGLVNQRNWSAKIRAALGIAREKESDIAAHYVDQARRLGGFITDTTFYVNQRLRQGGVRLLAESAQAFWLDIDHGMYPYTTSSSPTSGGVSTGLGISPTYIDRIVGVIKATQSHVGGGPFVTEVNDPDLQERLRGERGAVDGEYGTTTGRPRRMGYLDLVQIRRSNMVNGTTELIISKLDRVSEYGNSAEHSGQIPICTMYERKGRQLKIAPDSARKLDQSQPRYSNLPAWQEDITKLRDFKDLPAEAQAYIEFIEEETALRVSMIGVGPDHDQYIRR